jgi:hypothetical protein
MHHFTGAEKKVGRSVGKKKAQSHTGKAGLSNTTQFFRGRRVLRSGDPNNINLCVHRVHQ